MTRKSIFNSILAVAAVGVLAFGVSAQGKHGGKKHGGDHGKHGGGKHEKQWNGGGDDRGMSRHWGRQPRFDGSREFQQQIRWQNREQKDWAKDQRKAVREQFKQQRDFQRDQQRHYQQAIRDQRRQQRHVYSDVYPGDLYGPRKRHDNGRHNGWVNGHPRGNHYGWYSPEEKRFRKAMKKAEKADRFRYDPLVSYVPDYRGVEYYQDRPREYVMRSIISTFFTPQVSYYESYPAPRAHRVYQPQYYPGYSNVSYSPAYDDHYDPGYGYYSDDPYGSQLFGDGDLKSSLLNIGLSMLQGFLGQGYLDGLNQGMYAREVYGPQRASYYNPYELPDEYYSPYVSSLADERQVFEEGYRLGYEDGLRAQDPYAAFDGGIDNVDLISAFLTNTLIANV
jgi:hypothetical protein